MRHEPTRPEVVDCVACDGCGTHRGSGRGECELCLGHGELVLDLPEGYDSGDVDAAIDALRAKRERRAYCDNCQRRFPLSLLRTRHDSDGTPGEMCPTCRCDHFRK